MGALPRSFYARSVFEVARDLVGLRLVHDTPRGRLSGRIVEVEVYAGARDPASHAYRGLTLRNAVMFGPPGHAYVYFTYGMHHCINVVTGREGSASAVLIRALEPVEGEEEMRTRRGVVPRERLARGPGCVTSALALTLSANGADLTRPPLWVSREAPVRGPHRLVRGPRIGIRKAVEKPWRLFLLGHPCVSGPRNRGVLR